MLLTHPNLIFYLYTHQDDVPTFSNEIAFSIVNEELGQKFTDVFELVEPEPIAGAVILYYFDCCCCCCSSLDK